MWNREGIGEVRDTELGEDDDGAMNSSTKPQDVGMPPKGAPLSAQGEVVYKALFVLNRTLCDVCRAIRPSCP